MISERYAIGARAGALGGSKVRARPRRTWSLAPPWRRWTSRSALAGRARLTALRQSVLVRLILAMTLMALAALLYLAQASQVSVLQFSIAELQTERTQLALENASLRMTATNLKSVRRVDRLASDQLHMTKPDISTSVWVWPVIPTMPATPTRTADRASALQASQPVAWMHRFIRLVVSEL